MSRNRGCAAADLEGTGEGDVDLADFARFQQAFSQQRQDSGFPPGEKWIRSHARASSREGDR